VNDLRFVPAPDINIVAGESIVQDEKLAEVVLDFAMNSCRSFLMSSMTWSHRLPGYFASLIEATGMDLQSRLAVLQRWWHLLCNLELAAVGDRWVKGFLRDLLWPSEGFVREVFLMLYELEFKSLSDEVMTMLQGFGVSFSSTNINEDLFNQYRQRERASTKESFSRMARYHVASYSSLLKDYDRNPVHITEAAKSAST
jgi:hypothetical protein